MRIAFASYEFGRETGGGGIATYLAQACPALARLGHEVEVFAGTAGPAREERMPEGVKVTRVLADGSPRFREAVVAPFLGAHARRPFDVIEGTDFDASALDIKRALPGLPYVVKIHTPRFVVDELQRRRPTLAQRLRIAAGALRRGRAAPAKEKSAEVQGIELADEIAAPSEAAADGVRAWTRTDRARLSLFPLPYAPPPALLRIPPGGATGRITFIGRLEMRKGVIDLADAMIEVLRHFPGARLRLVGRAMSSPEDGVDMCTFLGARLGAARARTEFIDAVDPAAIPGLLAETDIVAAPSHWESYGLVCCEALAAARAVVTSAGTGMAEIVARGRCGVLVPPARPRALAAALVSLLGEPARRRALGEAGRAHVLEAFAPPAVLARQLESYQRARRVVRDLRGGQAA